MSDAVPAAVVTGISGHLGQRLLPQLAGFRVVGVDFRRPQSSPASFVEMDLGLESSCQAFLGLLREVRPVAVVHLAFVMDAVRTGVLDPERMWQANVAGTARVIEAITEANRDWPMVEKFVFLSSVAGYGTRLPQAAREETPLAAHSFRYGVHKMEADLVVQQRAPALRGASVYILRPSIFAGPNLANYFIEAFSGIPGGSSRRAVRMREQGRRLPCLLPSGKQYLENRIQFVHIDDVARLITFILKKEQPEAQRLTILNVAGRGPALSYQQCIHLAEQKLVRVPSEGLFRLILRLLWTSRISTLPPDIVPYLVSPPLMDTSRLEAFLGSQHKNVIRYPMAEAFAESFAGAALAKPAAQARL
jgi:nucleoside-diphosphate-sugar epimerase